MAGYITAIILQEKNKERVNIYIDDTFALATSLNVALSFKKGQFLSDDEIDYLKFNDEIDKAYQRSLNYLSYRARTQQEVEQYLYKKKVSDSAIDEVINRLINNGYLNDIEFAHMWVENRGRLNPKGKRALQYELQQKGLKTQDIEQVLENLDEEALAWQAIKKKLTHWNTLDKDILKKKLSGYLTRRGFNYEVIQNVFNKTLEERNK